MCFGGGQQQTNNVTTPAYAPEDVHKSVTRSVRPEGKVAEEEGMRDTTLAPKTPSTQASGLNVKGM